MATVRRLIGNIKGPKGDAATISVGTVSTGEPGTAVEVANSGTSSAATFNFTIPRGATGAPGAPGVTDYATTEAAGLVRVGDDFKINSGNGTLSMKNLFTTASTLAKMVSEEAFAISLGKIAKAVDWVVDNAPNFFNKSTDIVDGFNSALTDKALSANAGKTLKTQLDSLNDSLSNVPSLITDRLGSITRVIDVYNGGTYTFNLGGSYSPLFFFGVHSSYPQVLLIESGVVYPLFNGGNASNLPTISQSGKYMAITLRSGLNGVIIGTFNSYTYSPS